MPNNTGTNFTGPNEAGELHAWGGIVSARVCDLARSLQTTTEEIERAVEAVETVVDTAEPKGQRTNEERPTDPSLRSIALTKEELQTLAGEVERDPEAAPSP